MSLYDLLTGQPWAITPQALESICNAFGRLGASPVTAEGIRPHSQDEAASSALPTSRSQSGDAPYSLFGRVALIEVTGVIHRRAGHAWCFAWDGQDQIRSAFDEAMADPAVKAVLLSFDSPGGVAAGVKELADHIAAQTAKPVYAYADGLCASAAFWLASATGRLYAPVTATVGSIGVLQVHCDRSAANSAQGVRYTYITGGTWKASGHGDAPLSGPDQAYWQGMVDQLHQIFRNDVAVKTGVEASRPEAWGDGQVFLASKALELGLISGIVGDREALIAQINKETSMDKEKLAKEHPELLAEIRKEAAAEARAEAEKLMAASLENQLALFKVVAGDEAAGKVAAMAGAGLTAEQLTALGNIGFKVPVAPAAETSTEKEAAGRQEILTHLRKVTPGPVPALPNIKETNGLAAAIDRIGSL
jgi:signal peptide peptidase SppA